MSTRTGFVIRKFKKCSREINHVAFLFNRRDERLPSERLLVIDNHLSCLNDNIASVFQDFKADIFESLKEGIELLKKYNKIILVVPDRKINPYPNAIKEGFTIFCKEFDFDFELMDTIYPDMELQWKDIYILIEESDLIHFLQQVKAKNLKAGIALGGNFLQRYPP